jgi:hypothetical protein
MNNSSAQTIWRALILTWVIAVLPGCSGARLDPEKNQALTFDTSGPSDAGVQTPMLLPNRKAAPSQLAAGSKQQDSVVPAGTEVAQPDPIRCTQDPPDPKPTSTRDWFALDFKLVNDSIRLHSAHRVQTPKPRDAARVMGRYAVELWIGCELLDRVRFNFPLQAADAAANTSRRHALHEQPSLTARADLGTTVLVPFSDRATRAELVDRNAGTREALAWPPNLNNAESETSRKSPNQSR